MSLSEPVGRTLSHTRSLLFQGYVRDDGLFDVEGHIIDTKTFDIENKDRGGNIPAGEPLHEMVIRVTIDEHMYIHHAEASTYWAPFDYCKGGAASFEKLVGETIGPGWTRKVRSLLGDTNGCTHIREMLGQLATTAFQLLVFNRRGCKKNHQKPAILDTCHALASDSPVVAREWPQFYTGD